MPKRLANPEDIVGKRFGKLTVIRYIGYLQFVSEKDHVYCCNCDCGTINLQIKRRLLVRNFKKSCGCAHKDAGLRVKENLVGRKFGRLIVIEEAPTKISKSGKTRRVMWKCKCECGTVCTIGARALKTGMTRSCGCLHKERVSNALTNDLVGNRFGKLCVIKRAGSKIHGNSYGAMWQCKCDCGNYIDVLGDSLRVGDTRSCGCNKSSKYEDFTEQYLQSCGYMQNVDYYREKTFSHLHGINGGLLRFDFYVHLRNGTDILIECQGEQHYHSVDWYGGIKYFYKLQKHDQLKRVFAKQYNIQLIEINFKQDPYLKIANFLKQNKIF